MKGGRVAGSAVLILDAAGLLAVSGAGTAHAVVGPSSAGGATDAAASQPLAKAPKGLQEAVADALAGPASVLVQQGSKLAPAAGLKETGARLGASVAISADGSSALVAGPLAYGGAGAVWVFVQSGGVWTQQGDALAGSDEVGASDFGQSVALSADGNTALIGGSADNGNAGAAWVFTRSGATWTQQGPKLTPNDENDTTGGGLFGYRVALSGDGNTALIGGQGDGTAGAAWVFTRSGTTWTQQGPKLTGSGAADSSFGSGVSLSSDGNTALIGSDGATRAYVFTRSAGVWSQDGTALAPSDATGLSEFGESVALSSDGSTALIGGPLNTAAWVFTNSGGVWVQQGSRLKASDNNLSDNFGVAVAISSDGNTALIGGLGSDGGDAWLFTRSGSTWTQQGSKLATNDEVNGSSGADFGSGVAVDSSGGIALVGGPDDSDGTGAAWVFTNSGGAATQAGSKLVGLNSAEAGLSVAVSGDGNTALVGGPFASGGTLSTSYLGEVWVYARSGSTWSLQATLQSCGGEFGYSVALSLDGNTALIGCPLDNNFAGSASVFTRSGSTWTEQATLTPNDEDDSGGGGEFGESVALSPDGNTALIGAPFDGSNLAGAAWIFMRSGSTWTQQGSKLTGGGEDNSGGGGLFGTAVALSGDTGLALIGAPFDGGDHAGAAWVFTNSGGPWTQDGAKLVGGGEDNMWRRRRRLW